MIESITFREFRCFGNTRVDLGPLTVLVGPNAVGKSTVLEAIGPTFSARGRRANSQVVVRTGGRVVDLFTEGLPLVVQALQLRVDSCRQDNAAEPAPRLATHGQNLANVVFNLPREVQQRYSDQLCHLVPAYSSVEPKGHGNGRIGLEFRDRWSPDSWLRADHVSDGTILTAAYVVLAFQQDRPQVVTVEEPEQGLHPALIGHIVRVLRELSERGIQVVVATHSPVVLDHVDPSEVRFLRRDPQTGEVGVASAPVGHPDWSDYLRTFDDSPGGAWLSGGLGG